MMLPLPLQAFGFGDVFLPAPLLTGDSPSLCGALSPEGLPAPRPLAPLLLGTSGFGSSSAAACPVGPCCRRMPAAPQQQHARFRFRWPGQPQ